MELSFGLLDVEAYLGMSGVLVYHCIEFVDYLLVEVLELYGDGDALQEGVLDIGEQLDAAYLEFEGVGGLLAVGEAWGYASLYI